MNNDHLNEILYKVVFHGPSGAGKTCLLRRYSHDTFSESHLCTIGCDFYTKRIQRDINSYKLQLWDTAGQERFRTITMAGANGVLLCFDVSSVDSFNQIPAYYEEIKTQFEKLNQPFPPVILCGLKSDLEEKRQVSTDVVEAFANSNQMIYMESSAKNSVNVQETFETLLDNMIMQFPNENREEQFQKKNQNNLQNAQQRQKKSSCC